MSSDVTAKVVNRGHGEYGVHVKTKNPTGKIGDGGMIIPCDSKKEAKIVAKQVMLEHAMYKAKGVGNKLDVAV